MAMAMAIIMQGKFTYMGIFKWKIGDAFEMEFKQMFVYVKLSVWVQR